MSIEETIDELMPTTILPEDVGGDITVTPAPVPAPEPAPTPVDEDDSADLVTQEGSANSRTRVNAANSGSISSSVVVNNNSAADSGMGGSAGKDEQSKKDAEFRRLLADLARINVEISFLNKRIEANTKKLAAIEKDIGEIQTARGAIRNFLTTGKMPDRNADGSFKNEKLEQKLKEYESQYGKIDRDDPEDMKKAMLEIDMLLAKEEADKKIEWEQVQAQIGADKKRVTGLQQEEALKIQNAEANGIPIPTRAQIQKATEELVASNGTSGTKAISQGEIESAEEEFDSEETTASAEMGEDPVVISLVPSAASQMDGEDPNSGLTGMFGGAVISKAGRTAKAPKVLITNLKK